MTNTTYRRCSRTVSTVKKSTASMLCACVRRNSRHERSGSLAGGSEAGFAEELAYTGGGDREAEPAKLADDPLIAPPRVLTCEAQHQPADLAADRRPADSTWIRPALRHQPPVPAKQRRRGDEKRPPTRSRQQPARGGEEDSILGPQLRPSDLTTQHDQLVAEHHDLELLELVRSKAQRRELKKAPKYEVAERPEQQQDSSATRGRANDSTDQKSRHRRGTELTHPTGWGDTSSESRTEFAHPTP
jgi:hypothetical protein